MAGFVRGITWEYMAGLKRNLNGRLIGRGVESDSSNKLET